MSKWGEMYFRGEITPEEYRARITADAHEASLRQRERDRLNPEAVRRRRERALNAHREALEAHKRFYPERYAKTDSENRPWWKFWGGS